VGDSSHGEIIARPPYLRASSRSSDWGRRLVIRDERRADIHEAFRHLGCALIRLNVLERWSGTGVFPPSRRITP
jgi:hypothetical protein